MDDEPATVPILRVFLAGNVGIEHAGGFIEAARLPGRQGSVLFALLAAERHRSLTRDEIADRLWGESPPSSWEGAISALVSKIRRMLDEADPTGTTTVKTAFGAHQIRFPVDTWVDLEIARARIDAAEAALRDGEMDRAWGDAHVAWSISTRDFLLGEDAPWIDEQRRELDELAVRALGCMAEVWLDRGEFELSATCAREVIKRRPFREAAYRRLMRAQAGAGNRAEALRTFDECRALLDTELGVGPDPDTIALREELLGKG